MKSFIIKSLVRLLTWYSKITLRNEKFECYAYYDHEYVYRSEFTLSNRKVCVAYLLIKYFWNESNPFETDFYQFIEELKGNGLCEQLYHYNSRGDYEEQESYVFADGSVIEVYSNITGYWEPEVREIRGKTFFLNPNKAIEKESLAECWEQKMKMDEDLSRDYYFFS